MSKFTKLEKQWILYDVGNSAFTMLVSTIIPIYFKNVASLSGISPADSTAYWGYAVSLSTIIVAILGPILGTVADTRGYKKPLFSLFMMFGVLGCAALALPVPWIIFLAIFVIGKVGFSGSLILFADKIGLTTAMATGTAFILTALWWLLITMPLLKNYKQKYYVEKGNKPVAESFKRLGKVLLNIRKNKKIFLFLLAFFFYIDGVHTIISMSTSYGKDVGITDSNLLLALLLTQVVAFPCAILFGRLSKKFKSDKLIAASIMGYIAITIFALQLDKAWEFWILAVCVAVFQGAIQALSRSYFSKIIPKEKSSEYFGLYDIFGKGAAFMGTMLMSIATHITGSSKAGVAGIVVMFIFGLIIFKAANKVNISIEKETTISL